MKNYLTVYSFLGIGGAVLLLISLSCARKTPKVFETSDSFSLLWEISGNEAGKPSYLYGTIHMYDTSIFKIPQQVYWAIDNSETLALEIDMSTVNAVEMTQRMLIPDADSTLDKVLNPIVYEEIVKVPFIKMMGEQANRMKPLFLAQYLMVDNPMAMMSVEIDLTRYANSHEKTIIGLETIDEQFDVMDKISIAEQAEGIEEMYAYCQRENMTFQEAGKFIFSRMQQYYKQQDFEKLVNLEEEFKLASGTPVLSDSVMIANRNINMADRIDDSIKQGNNLFAAVGALHLPDYKEMRGVVNLLKEKGYKMRPILIEL